MTTPNPPLDLLERLLAEATPGPWERRTYGHASLRQAAGKVTRGLFAVDKSVPGGADRALRDTFTDMTYIVTEDGKRNIALIGNGPKQIPNAEFLVYAANNIERVEARLAEAERLLAEVRGWWDGGEGDGPSVLAAVRAFLAQPSSGGEEDK